MTGVPTSAGEAVAGLCTGDVIIDLRGRELRRDGERVHVEPQVFDVVRYLVEHAGRVVPKEELLDEIWGTRFVTESALTSRIKSARRAFGDDGREQRVIQTVHGRGYRWIAPLEPWLPVPDATVNGPEGSRDAALPRPLTPFVGRRRELADLLDALRNHRLVTATGPGGVGKTRLALAAAEVTAREALGGVAFADLAEVSDPSMVVGAIADAVGVHERLGFDPWTSLHAWLAEREWLIVIDNCEHVVDEARTCVEALLRACSGVRVLATSRLRLMLAFEHVYAVPGLSLADESDPAAADDAAELFATRAAAAGAVIPDDPASRDTVRALCRALDGMALAIELASARVPALGLDGLAATLGEQLMLLDAGRRRDHRHRSLRGAIDWTYELLDEEERRTLRAAAPFAAPFSADALAAVLGRPVVETLASLGRLVDWNLVTRPSGAVGRFRLLETIRQYATDRARDAGELDRWSEAHRDWVEGSLGHLLDAPARDDAWCAAVDQLLAEARAALVWAGEGVVERDAAGLADRLATVCFERGWLGEAQRRYAQAARWATTDIDRHAWLRSAAGAAATRNVGLDALALLDAAAVVAEHAGLNDEAAADLAVAAMYCNRASGIMGRPITPADADGRVARARALTLGGPVATAAIAVAEGWRPDSTARSPDAARAALELARHAGDPLLESAALDLMIVVELAADDLEGAETAVRARRDLLAVARVDARSGFERYDADHMSCHIDLARGEFEAARRHANVLAERLFLREDRHVALSRRMEVDAVSGAFAQARHDAELFEQDWVRAGRPMASNLAVSSYAVAMAYGMLGDAEQRARWVDITRQLVNPSKRALLHEVGWAPTMDALVDLHDGDPDAALGRLAADPDDDAAWSNANRRLWRTWYAAAWAEAGVLAHLPDPQHRLARAAAAVRGNAVAEILVERARHLLFGDLDAVRATGAMLEHRGAIYQAARSGLLAGATGR